MKKRNEILLEKAAMLFVISEILDKHGNKPIYFEGYENDNDRVRFQFDGHKCKLLELNSVNLENGTIVLTVLEKGVELKVLVLASHFRYEKLEEIAVEAYMHTNSPDDDDVDTYIKEKLANYFDTFG